MKTQIVFTCKRCGKEQIENITFFNVLKFKFRNLVISEKYSWDGDLKTVTSNSYELCSDCCKSLKIWLRNGNEYQELIDENHKLNEQKTYLCDERIKLQEELKQLSNKFNSCKTFCPKENPDYEEYCKWHNKKLDESFKEINK